MPMYNLLEYSDNCSMTSGSLWNSYRDCISDDANENNAANNRINSNKTITSKSFEYNKKLIESMPNSNNILDAEFVVLLKYLCNFQRSFDLQFINCKIFDLSWSKEHIISEISITSAVPGNPNANPPVPEVSAIQSTEAKFRMNNPKIFVPVVALSINANMKFFEKIKQGIKRTISWNKCRSDITTETKNNNLDYLVDPAFRNINRLFVVSSKNGNNDPTRNYFK